MEERKNQDGGVCWRHWEIMRGFMWHAAYLRKEAASSAYWNKDINFSQKMHRTLRSPLIAEHHLL